MRSFPIPEMFERITSGDPYDIALFNWLADYPDPYDFINIQFGEGLGPGLTPAQHNEALTGTDLNRRMREAAMLTGDERYQAYAELDHDVMAEAAPIVPYASGTNVTLFSDRIGCQVEQPIYGIDLGRLCVR